MKICPVCSHGNREGFYFCEECGQGLQGIASSPTRKIDSTSTRDFQGRTSWGTSHFVGTASIVLQIRDADPVVLRPERRTMLGRHDINSFQKPDLDLTPYGAVEKGVSRIHAAIYRNEDSLTLVDMGSANGTFLNGQRLSPEQPRVLRDGDEIRLGKLVAHIYFRPD